MAFADFLPTTLPFTATEFAVALGLATLGSAIQGAVGFGLAVITAPVMILLNSHSVFVPGPLLLAAMILTVLMAYRERTDVAFREVGIAAVGRVVGMLPAAAAMSVLDQRYYSVLFAALILLGIAMSVSGWHWRPTPGNLLVASTMSGFSGTVSSVGGPPLALVYQHERGPHIRGTMSAIFTLGTVISLSGLWAADKFGQNELLAGLLLAPGVLLGFFVSRYLIGVVDGAYLRPLILAVSGVSALVILLRVVLF
jgi:uncharacterized membrane protein YfcA